MKKVISAILLTAMLLSILAMGGCSLFDKSGDLPKFEKGKLFYVDGHIVYLNGDDAQPLGHVYGSDTEKSELSKFASEYDAVQNAVISYGGHDTFTDGKSIYYAKQDGICYMHDMKKGVLLDEYLVDAEELRDLFDISDEDTFLPSFMKYWQVVGDKVYFVVLPGKEYLFAEPDKAYNVGWMSLDGKDGELFDVTASSFVVAGDRIYYFSNGYEGYEYEFDGDRGLYSMNLNGNDREEVYVDEYNTDYYGKEYAFAAQMKAVGKYVYFIDSSEDGENRVARLNTNNGEVEHITEKGAFSFAVDEKGKKVYYTEGEGVIISNEDRTIRVVDFSGKNDEKLFECTDLSTLSDCVVSYDDGYLYMSRYNGRQSLYRDYDEDEPALLGARYDIKKEIVEVLYAYSKVETEKVAIAGPGNHYEENITAREFFAYWEEDDSIID